MIDRLGGLAYKVSEIEGKCFSKFYLRLGKWFYLNPVYQISSGPHLSDGLCICDGG